jgi:hypothetical protein
MSTTIVADLTPPIHSTFGEDSPRARRTDPHTSHEAADSNDVTKSIGLVLRILKNHGPLADHEIEEQARRLLYGWSFTGQRLRTARKALVRKGLVEASGLYRLTENNRRAIVWQLSEEGPR